MRTRRWWAQSASSEVLHIPAWSTADAKFIGEIHMDLQVSPTGRYAVAFAGANWSQKGDGVPFAPKVARKPDTIITVIDLEQWTIVKSIHTKSFEETDFRGGRIMNGNWIALQGLGIRTSPGYSVYLRHNRLLSIPDLTPGPECTSRRGSSGRENDSTCREILKSTSTASVKALEARVYMGQDPEPTALLLRSLDSRPAGYRGSLADAEQREENEYFDHWERFPPRLYLQNAPLESSSHLWYGLYDSHDLDVYELERLDAEGQKQMGRKVQHLLCGDSSLDGGHSACGCRVEDVSEEQHGVLAHCTTQRGDYDGGVQRKWLSIVRSDDLLEVGLIPLAKAKHSSEVLAGGNGRAYVLVVESGETLRVYAVPDRP